MIRIGNASLHKALLAASFYCLAVCNVLGQEDIRRDAAVRAVEKIMPSVVNISTATLIEIRDPYEDFLSEFFGYRQRRRSQAQYSRGSGVIIDESGYILTNDHVVRDAWKIWVTLHGREAPVEAEVARMTSDSDLALLKFTPPEGLEIKAAEFADAGDLILGETVLAAGNPYGLGGSVSKGILSSKSRRPYSNETGMNLDNWLQTDAAINPGNSGGPLINLNGDVIGVNVAVLREGQGIGFAIPNKIVLQSLSEFFAPELDGVWFGASLRSARRPLVVDSVEKESPAALAGMKPGDEILAVNEVAPKNFIQLNGELMKAGARGRVDLSVRREGRPMKLTVNLIPVTAFFNEDYVRAKLGVSVQVLGSDTAMRLGLRNVSGLIVTDVAPGSPAAEANLQKRMIIRRIDGIPADTALEAARHLHGKSAGDEVVLDLIVPSFLGRLPNPYPATAKLAVR